MGKILVAVGSTRRPKLNAVWEALTVVGPSIDSNAEFAVTGLEVKSGVRDTPLSRAEIMTGASNRVRELVGQCAEMHPPPDFFVGLEGGFDIIQEQGRRLVFLQNWAFVSGNGRWSYGQSGAILVPEPVARMVVDEGRELAAAIDAFAGGQGIRDAQGAWGVFTGNLITRQDAFRVAVINAFAPFFNRAAYPGA